ncbi:unnamed protein product [Protopolystoma xenopodis]|uniref:Uncharacterized protein n=1 Tax=Protopolystoma xenopodis TaxID=117903 RepID=A0A448XEW1_9PLAT|nr:unnamed protein product [Protopolystoma xenopodis]
MRLKLQFALFLMVYRAESNRQIVMRSLFCMDEEVSTARKLRRNRGQTGLDPDVEASETSGGLTNNNVNTRNTPTTLSNLTHISHNHNTSGSKPNYMPKGLVNSLYLHPYQQQQLRMGDSVGGLGVGFGVGGGLTFGLQRFAKLTEKSSPTQAGTPLTQPSIGGYPLPSQQSMLELATLSNKLMVDPDKLGMSTSMGIDPDTGAAICYSSHGDDSSATGLLDASQVRYLPDGRANQRNSGSGLSLATSGGCGGGNTGNGGMSGSGLCLKSWQASGLLPGFSTTTEQRIQQTAVILNYLLQQQQQQQQQQQLQQHHQKQENPTSGYLSATACSSPQHSSQTPYQMSLQRNVPSLPSAPPSLQNQLPLQPLIMDPMEYKTYLLNHQAAQLSHLQTAMGQLRIHDPSKEEKLQHREHHLQHSDQHLATSHMNNPIGPTVTTVPVPHPCDGVDIEPGHMVATYPRQLVRTNSNLSSSPCTGSPASATFSTRHLPSNPRIWPIQQTSLMMEAVPSGGRRLEPQQLVYQLQETDDLALPSGKTVTRAQVTVACTSLHYSKEHDLLSQIKKAINIYKISIY